MTTPMLDRAAARRLASDAEVISVRRLPQGRFNTCWQLTGHDRSYLLKFNNREGEAHLQKTAEAMIGAAARGVEVPQVLRLGRDPNLGPFLLQEWLPGRTFTEARRTDAITANLWPALAEQIALLHNGSTIAVPATPASRVRHLSDLLHRLGRDQLIPADLEEVARRRGAVLADMLGDHPVVNTHQDIHPDNILIRPGGQIALLDFDHATIAEDVSDFVKIDRWCLPAGEDRRLLLDAYWRQRGQPADPMFEHRLAFYRLVIHLSYVLYWHNRDSTQIPGCVAALRNELE